MSTLLADARHALRLIARSPGYALAVIAASVDPMIALRAE